jgi:hypothetical protein
MTVAEVLEQCERIRKAHPHDPIGDHWECWEVPMGDVWCDPKFMKMKGEMQHLAEAEVERQVTYNR